MTWRRGEGGPKHCVCNPSRQLVERATKGGIMVRKVEHLEGGGDYPKIRGPATTEIRRNSPRDQPLRFKNEEAEGRAKIIREEGL